MRRGHARLQCHTHVRGEVQRKRVSLVLQALPGGKQQRRMHASARAQRAPTPAGGKGHCRAEAGSDYEQLHRRRAARGSRRRTPAAGRRRSPRRRTRGWATRTRRVRGAGGRRCRRVEDAAHRSSCRRAGRCSIVGCSADADTGRCHDDTSGTAPKAEVVATDAAGSGLRSSVSAALLQPAAKDAESAARADQPPVVAVSTGAAADAASSTSSPSADGSSSVAAPKAASPPKVEELPSTEALAGQSQCRRW